MRFSVALAVLAFPTVALAGPTEAPVIGGSSAAAGKWPDATAVMWSGEQECTGTLIAPNVVITAGHCVLGGAPNGVLVGASALSRASEGETLQVMKWYEYPSSQRSVDVGVLVLDHDSRFAPRPIATGWARADIKNGAAIELVGYGTTDRNGTVSTDDLMEAQSTITDYNCAESSGCNVAARPDGELGAGGMGIDTCPGDSGGPLYLLTDYGAFLAGVTSRAYDNARYDCSEGGIYGRPDKIFDWIQQTTGATLLGGPTPEAKAITATRGNAGETKITHNDPKSDAHTYAVTTQPLNGKAAVSEDGVVRVCANKDVVGTDAVTVTVTDKNDATRAVTLTVPVNIVDGDPDDDCDPEAFGEDGGGCCSASRDASGSISLAAFVLLVLRRRRR
jgi:endonuclease G